MTESIFSGARIVPAAAEQLAIRSGGRIEVSADPFFLMARAMPVARRVGLVSGGGSGHEPMHGGFIGPGGLDAVAPGAVFASPHNRQVTAAAKAAAREDGVLLIVKNYTGDRINFSIAAERLRHESIPVAVVVVDDDVASRDGAIGGRGTAATVLVEKILGAAADAGTGLDALQALGDRAVGASRSIGVALRAPTLPSTSQPVFELAPGEVEYGVGIHGERGIRRLRADDLEQLVGRMVDDLLASLGDHGELVLLVNDLGALTDLETAAVSSAARAALERAGVVVVSVVAGRYCTALDMRGFSITVMRADPELLRLLFAPHDAPALPTVLPLVETWSAELVAPRAGVDADAASIGLDRLESAVAQWYPVLAELDRVAGDGDFGHNLMAGIRAARGRRGSDLERLAGGFLDDVGGTSGPLFGLLFQHLGSAEEWTSGLAPAADAIARVGDARRGDRTLLDALIPAAEAATHGGDVERVVRAAVDGAIATTTMTASRGRAAYLDERVLGSADPGAVGAAIVLGWLAGTGTGMSPADVGGTG